MKPGADVYNISDMDEKMWEYAKFLVENNPTAIMGISTVHCKLLKLIH